MSASPHPAHLAARIEPASSGAAAHISVRLTVDTLCLFRPVVRCLVDGPGLSIGEDSHQVGWHFHWLPRGGYDFSIDLTLPDEPGDYKIRISWGTPEQIRPADAELTITQAPGNGQLAARPPAALRWFMADETAARIGALPWQGGLNNWFFRHFDHAATVICEQFLKNSPKLSGKILDIGAGDGITDLGILLRHDPEVLVAVDIVDYAHQLISVAGEHGLPMDALPDNFVFVQGSAEQLPYPDEYFDLVLSWGSVEHIKGGYRRALDEVWRTLKPGGLFFVNPGLYYAPYGSHLAEFFTEPHHHLKMDEASLRQGVLSAEPKRIDRAGFDVPSSEYWRFYKELNPIRVADFEAELKAYGYRIVRAALRVADMVEYPACTDALQAYSVLDLATEDAFFVLEKPLKPVPARSAADGSPARGPAPDR